MAAPNTKPAVASNPGAKAKVAIGDFGLNEIWDIVQRRKSLIILSVVMMWMLGLAYCYYAQQTYESAAQVLVMQKDPAMVSSSATAAKTTSDAGITEDLLATHLQILQSQLIIDAALQQTIKLSDLNKFKQAYQASEELTSPNLRYMLARLFNPPPETAKPIDPNTALTPSTAPATATEGSVTPSEATTESTNPLTTIANPAASQTAAVTTPATTLPNPVATNPNATTTPAQTTPVAGAPATTDSAAAPGAEAAAPAIDPVTGLPVATEPGMEGIAPETPPIEVETKFTLLTSNPAVLPPGPLPDGDKVLTLADLPSLVEELDAIQLPNQYVSENLIIARGGAGQARTSHVLTVAFRHPDPVEARLILDAILMAYQVFLTNQFQDVNKQAADLIENVTTVSKKELDAALDNYQKFREQSPILFSSTDGATATASNIYKTRSESAEAELTTIQIALTEARSRLGVTSIQIVELSKPNVSQIEKFAIIDEKNIPRIAAIVQAGTSQAQLSGALIAYETQRALPALSTVTSLDVTEQTRLETALAGKLQTYGPNHEEVKQARAVLDDFKKSLVKRKEEKPTTEIDVEKFNQLISFNPDEVLRSYENMLRMDVKVLERREQELLEIAETQKELARALDPYELEEQRLRGEVSRAQDFYDTTLDQLRQINLAKDYSGFVNEIIDTPKFGSEVWPSVPIVMIVATMFGLLMGVGGAALTEYRDRSFRDPDDIRRDLGMTLLTHIPNLQGRVTDRRQLVEGSKMHATVYAYHRPKSREAEVFRGLRTSLFFSTQGQKCQVLGFTSPNQGDGKSTVTSNLAVSIAQTGRKVLLVDCDLRRPNVHKLLGISNDVGLSDVIGGEMEPWDAIQQTETTNLWSLPSGPLPANPAELLTSAMFEEFVKVAREKFDYVLLDCPPVLAVADPCIVAPRTDGMTLVLRVSKDSRPQAQRAKEMLDRVHARMLGVVVNASQEAHKTGYGRYGESSYAYSYDYGYGGYGYSSYNKYYEEDSTTTARSNRSGR